MLYYYLKVKESRAKWLWPWCFPECVEAADEDVDGSESVAITKDFQEGGAFVFVITALSCIVGKSSKSCFSKKQA